MDVEREENVCDPPTCPSSYMPSPPFAILLPVLLLYSKNLLSYPLSKSAFTRMRFGPKNRWISQLFVSLD